MIGKFFGILTLTLFPALAYAEKIEVTVAGMVCSFCAQGIESTISREPGVQEVLVELEKQRVTVVVDAPTPLSDEKLRSLIMDAGYDVQKITRTEG